MDTLTGPGERDSRHFARKGLRAITALRVVVVAQESAGIKTVRLVVDRGHDLVAVLTDPDREPARAASVASAARDVGAEIRDATLVRAEGVDAWLREQRIDLLLNVHSLFIAHPSVVAAARIGSFNLHPGPLPSYPGLNAPSWAIFEGARSYGCTVHWMSPTVDAGPIAYAATFPVTEQETGLSLSARCVHEGIPLLARLLDDATHGGADAVPRIAQVGERIERGAGPPNGGRVMWSLTAARIDALARACHYGPFPSPWGRPRFVVEGKEVHIVRARAVEPGAAEVGIPGEVLSLEGDDALVATGDGLLRISRLADGDRLVAPAAVLRPGIRLAD